MLDHDVMFETIDDLLGPAKQRFFGDGYKRVDHRLTGLLSRVDERDRHIVSAAAAVGYPPDWSTKSGSNSELRPHLSTVDALVFAAQLGECCLALVLGLDEGARRRAWLRSFDMKAGAAPQERLHDIPVEAAYSGTEPSRHVLGGHCSVVVCTVGGMRVRCEIEHEMPVCGPAGIDSWAAFPDVESILGPASTRYYGMGYRTHTHVFNRLSVAAGTSRVDAGLRVERGAGAGAFLEGLCGIYQPSLAMVDSLVVLAQLAQVLMYQIDDVDRSRSNTLWMRRVSMTADAPVIPLARIMPTFVEAARSNLVSFGGGTWRTVEFFGGFPGCAGKASLAHALPGAAPVILTQRSPRSTVGATS